MELCSFSVVNLDWMGCGKYCQVEEYMFQMVKNMHWAMALILSNMLLGDHHKLFARGVQSKNFGYASTKNRRRVPHFFPLNNSHQFVAMKYYCMCRTYDHCVDRFTVLSEWITFLSSRLFTPMYWQDYMC